MSTVTPRLDESLAVRLERLKQELSLALKWDRPSILLAVYASEFVRADAEAMLARWLREMGLSVARIRITGPDDPVADVPQTLREWPDREETVFFVAGLADGAPTTWQTLNVRREYLVEDRVRAVFWLTEREAATLPRRAPDFWAFRHWVVEFLEIPRAKRAAERAGELAWRGFEERLPARERRARIGLRERLLSELGEARETTSARAALHYTLGGLYSWDGEHQEALVHLRRARELAERLEDASLRAWALTGLGNVYRDLGRYEEAIAAYQQAIELVPDNAYPHNNLANVYYQQGRYEEAIASYRRAIEFAPQYVSPHNGLGSVYRDLGRYEEAMAAYQRAIELNPDFALPYKNLGNVYYQQGRYRDAIATFERAIELEPEDPVHHDNLGLAYHRLGRHQEAIAAFQRAVELDPEDALAYYNQACAYSRMERPAAALESLAKAIEMDETYRELAREDEDFDRLRENDRFRAIVGSTSNELDA